MSMRLSESTSIHCTLAFPPFERIGIELRNIYSYTVQLPSGITKEYTVCLFKGTKHGMPDKKTYYVQIDTQDRKRERLYEIFHHKMKSLSASFPDEFCELEAILPGYDQRDISERVPTLDFVSKLIDFRNSDRYDAMPKFSILNPYILDRDSLCDIAAQRDDYFHIVKSKHTSTDEHTSFEGKMKMD